MFLSALPPNSLLVEIFTPFLWSLNFLNAIILLTLGCSVKIAEDMTPPVPLQKILIFLSNIMPQAKIVPTKDLAELALKEIKKRKMVMSLFTPLC